MNNGIGTTEQAVPAFCEGCFIFLFIQNEKWKKRGSGGGLFLSSLPGEPFGDSF